MNRIKRLSRALPLWTSSAVFLLLGFYFLPHLAYFSGRPVLLLSEDASRTALASTGHERSRIFNRVMAKNVQGVVFHQDTLQDLQKAGRTFVASGEELLRLFKLQSVASYYVFEQVRDKNLKPAGSYVFFSEAALFERVFADLKLRLTPGSIDVYERGIFRGDASFPDNFILEASIPVDALKNIPLGWPRERIRETLAALQPHRGDTLWAVLWSDPSAFDRNIPEPEMDMPSTVRLQVPLLRFPYDSIRVVHDPIELVDLPRGSDLRSLLALPPMSPHLPLALSMLTVLAGVVCLSQWFIGAILAAAVLLVLALSLLPTHESWVLGGVAALLPPLALLSWLSAVDFSKLRAPESGPGFLALARVAGLLVLFLGSAGWLLSTLLWQFPQLPLAQFAAYGILIVPFLSVALFLSVWGIEVSSRPVYPRHIRTGVEMAAAAVILYSSAPQWMLVSAAVFAWARWLGLLEKSRGRSMEDSPGNYAAFFVASAFSLKLFFAASPLSAMAQMAFAFGCGVAFSTVWLSRTARTA